MSVSIDKEATDGNEDARGVLASWLDDYTAGKCDRADMQASFLDICRSNPEAPWDALALLDQYQRRGRVEVALARSLKSDIAQLVFGVANQTEASRPEVREPASDTTGSRWRKLAERRDEPSVGDSRFDPTRFRRDFDPLTRPPASQPVPRPARMPPPTAQASQQPQQRPEQRPEQQPGQQSGQQPDKQPEQQPPPYSAANAAAPVHRLLRDRYELQAVLGRGHSGTVYKALDRHRAHLSDSARYVAVKVLKLNYKQQPEALAVLEREFHQAQSLSHQNIVSMFDLDRDGDTYFLVMEMLEGELLADVQRRLDHQPIARDRALAILGSIGAALAHAHRRDIVHADLKPGNVMITSAGEIKVLDFGFARSQPLEPWIGDSADDGLTASQTPAYASAERVNGEEPHASEDVYSLACIAYELLSGHHPYGGRSALLARAHGREPRRIDGLSQKQWGALRCALRWSQSERQIDIMGLISALGCADVRQRVTLPQELLPAAAQYASGLASRRLALAGLLVLALVIAAAVVWSERWLPATTEHIGPPEEIAQGSVLPAEEPVPANEPAVESIVIEPLPQAQPATEARAATAPPAQSEVDTTPRNAPVSAEGAAAAAAVAKEASAARGQELIQFDKDTYVATESDGSVTLTVRRTGSTRNEALFRWSLQSNSAEAGKDFADIGPGIERIPAGSRTAVLTIPLVSDAIAENTELFLVELTAIADGAAIGELSRAAVILVDDD